jgi:A/G-specific adenine glycosylase
MIPDHMPAAVSRFPYDDIFAWYDRHGRSLPWRYRWPEMAPVYHLWLSEIMLQQTVVATVIPYFLEFTRRWPTIGDLAVAPVDDVLAAWAGLGYYARARNLHKTAKIVAHVHAGVFPKNKQDLLALPGIGPYTAGAILVMGYGQPGVVVDGNIERVMSRYFAIQTPLPKAKAEIAVTYAGSRPDARPSDFPQALMDFANAVCTPKMPGCSRCPLASSCRGYGDGIAEQLPRKAAKPAKPRRRGVAFVAINQHGEVFVQRRPDSGLLGGMTAFPSSGWTQAHRSDADAASFDAAAFDAAPFDADWQKLQPAVQHVFTHFALDMTVYVAGVHTPLPVTGSGWWQKPRPSQLPSLMRKIWKQVEGYWLAAGGFKDKPSSQHGNISVILEP